MERSLGGLSPLVEPPNDGAAVPANACGFHGILTLYDYHYEMTNSTPQAAQPRIRRLADKLRLMFHAACDEAEFSMAEQRLNQLCKHTISSSMRPAGLDRRKPETCKAGPVRRSSASMQRLPGRFRFHHD